MKTHYRLALPRLSELAPDTPLPFAVLDDNRQIRASGRSTAGELASSIGTGRVHAVLHPLDAVVVQIKLPPLPASRLAAAVSASIEPLAVQEPSRLAIAFGPRSADGSTPVAWADKAVLLQSSRVLHDAGLTLDSLVPHTLALPADDPSPRSPLALPADHRWTAPLPDWSLARAAWRPNPESPRWRPVLGWALATLTLWAIGLHLYAAKLDAETDQLQTYIERTLASAFPDVDVWLDPMKQAQQQLSVLQTGLGRTSPDEFIPLALAASQTLQFPVHQVQALHYSKGTLALTVGDSALENLDAERVAREALTHGLVARQDTDNRNRWHVQLATPPVAGRQP